MEADIETLENFKNTTGLCYIGIPSAIENLIKRI